MPERGWGAARALLQEGPPRQMGSPERGLAWAGVTGPWPECASGRWGLELPLGKSPQCSVKRSHKGLSKVARTQGQSQSGLPAGQFHMT